MPKIAHKKQNKTNERTNKSSQVKIKSKNKRTKYTVPVKSNLSEYFLCTIFNISLLIHYVYDIIWISGHFWVGGTDVLVDGQWIWISSQEKIQYTDWVPGEPNGGTREGCLMLYGGKFNFHWNDANCHSLQFFICEKQ